MKIKSLLFYASVVMFVFLIYFFFYDKKINYVSLGDSVASGQTPYGEKVGYGYTDFIKDHLYDNNMLKNYSDYAVSGYKTTDIINDIKNNRSLDNTYSANIKKDLREANLVTISIGANDFLDGINFSNFNISNIDFYLKKVDKVINNVDIMLDSVLDYAKNKVVIIGYYNPIPVLFKTNEKEIDTLFNYIDSSYKALCDKYKISYLSIYPLFKLNPEFLPNPFDIHPSVDGYRKIADLFIKTYLK